MSLIVANRNKSNISKFFVAWLVIQPTGIFSIFLLKPHQQALKTKDNNVHCGSIGRRNSSITRSNSNQCLVNLALIRHSLMVVEFGAGDQGSHFFFSISSD